MRTIYSSSAALFILFNILFLYATQGQDATPSDPATAPALSSDPQSPNTTNPTPSSPQLSPTTAPPPSSPPAGLDCSHCRINPIGLASCGLLINGFGTPFRTCCRTLRPLTKGESAACLCNAININTIKIGNSDVLTAVDKVLAACNKL